MVSAVGSKSSCPDSAKAMTVSGDVTKLRVLAEPSLRFGKLRLNELTMVLGTPFADGGRAHWQIQGPQALASTVAPMASRSASRPSLLMVALICSDPGVISRSVLTLRPRAEA